MIVRAYHNVERDPDDRPAGMLDGYRDEHRLVLVFVADVQGIGPLGRGDLGLCEWAYRLLNVGEDPGFGTPDPRAVTYRARGNRSLSVGDVVQVGLKFYAVAAFGFTRVDFPTGIQVDPEPTHGTTPIPGAASVVASAPAGTVTPPPRPAEENVIHPADKRPAFARLPVERAYLSTVYGPITVGFPRADRVAVGVGGEQGRAGLHDDRPALSFDGSDYVGQVWFNCTNDGTVSADHGSIMIVQRPTGRGPGSAAKSVMVESMRIAVQEWIRQDPDVLVRAERRELLNGIGALFDQRSRLVEQLTEVEASIAAGRRRLAEIGGAS